MSDKPRVPNVLVRAITVMRSRKLRRFAGNDISEIQQKVESYYRSFDGRDYYSHLAEHDVWGDTARRKHFVEICQYAKSILDFGCGAGGLAVSIAERFPGKKVHATDIGQHAGALIGGHNKCVEFRNASFLKAPYENDTMDLVISRFVIEHTTQPQIMINEAYRILKPMGIMYLLYPQLLLKVNLSTIVREIITWLTCSDDLIYLDPYIGDETKDTDDQDAVWLTNPVKVNRMLKKAGFRIRKSVPTQSLVIAEKK